VYVGGDFTQSGDGTLTDLGSIARYDTTTGTWHALPNQGLNRRAITLAVSDADLVAGGWFTQTTDASLTSLGRIVRGPLAFPEIQVLDGTNDIPDGLGSVDFGVTPAGTPITKTFTVSNTGTANLTLTEPITVPSGFSIASSFGSTSVAPGNATTFSVRLDSSVTVTYSGTLQFTNNDADENPFNFSVSGSVLQSGSQTADVTPSGGGSLVHTSMQAGQPVTTTIQVPANAVTQTTTLAYLEKASTGHPAPGDFTFAGTCFELDAYLGSVLQPGFTFAQPVTLTLEYNPSALSGVGEDTLELQYWDGSQWSSDGISIVSRDTVNHRLVVTVDHLSEFALLGEAGRRGVYLPVVMAE
jgi:hypothetical protein